MTENTYTDADEQRYTESMAELVEGYSRESIREAADFMELFAERENAGDPPALEELPKLQADAAEFLHLALLQAHIDLMPNA